MKVKEIMTRDVVTVDKDEKLERVVSLMEKHRISKVPVVERGGLVGVVTDGDVVDELGAIRNKATTANSLHVSSAMRRNPLTINPDADVEDAVDVFRENGLGLLPVVHDRSLVGVVTKSDLLPLVEATKPLSAIMISQLHAVEPGERVIHARRLMLDHEIEHLPVLLGGRLVGILSEMDIAIGLARFKDSVPVNRQHAQLKAFLVDEIMVRNVTTATPDMPANEAARLMRAKDVGALPVIAPAGKIAGLVTRSDLLGLVET
ncbi:MAG TPA: CBS domain-containing protein [Candidatus Thermoplasmatota archaeon]|nr:CBS domain-containing protein [Candidatus Thermoplasmatota archaeon]